ncbi:MAG: hypothetical protein LUE09_08345, partial [Synergistaceae bacterium]|nr:hypothetical protein [Synergistaceae bacterium]
VYVSFALSVFFLSWYSLRGRFRRDAGFGRNKSKYIIFSPNRQPFYTFILTFYKDARPSVFSSSTLITNLTDIVALCFYGFAIMTVGKGA